MAARTFLNFEFSYTKINFHDFRLKIFGKLTARKRFLNVFSSLKWLKTPFQTNIWCNRHISQKMLSAANAGFLSFVIWAPSSQEVYLTFIENVF